MKRPRTPKASKAPKADVLQVPCWPQLRRTLELEAATSCLGGSAEEVAKHLIVCALEARRIERQKQR